MDFSNQETSQAYKSATKIAENTDCLLINITNGMSSRAVYKQLIDKGVPKDDIAFDNPDGSEVLLIYLKAEHLTLAQNIGYEPLPLDIPFEVLKEDSGIKYAEHQLSELKKNDLFKKIKGLESYLNKKHEDINNDSFRRTFLQKNSRVQLSHDLNSISSGISTGFKIGDIDLIFPGGALSIIAAPTGHGKTTFLINCALGIMKNNPDKNVYFMSYEENKAAIMLSFLNPYVNLEITTGNNRSSIESYFRSCDTTYIKQAMQQPFIEKVSTFFTDLIDSGRLKVSYPDLSAEHLVNAIHFIKDNDPFVGTICIDYMQLLKLELQNGRTLSRQEELKRICLMIKDCAIKTGLPIILTAQFNRQVTTEAHLMCTNIGEAGDIERIAALIVGLFNRNCYGNIGRDGKGIDPEPTMKVEILKGRHIGNGHSDVLDFDGNIGKIKNIELTHSPASLAQYTNSSKKAKDCVFDEMGRL